MVIDGLRGSLEKPEQRSTARLEAHDDLDARQAGEVSTAVSSTSEAASQPRGGSGGGGGAHDLVVVANRLPVRRGSDGGWSMSPGGLVSAVKPVMERRPGAWIGWSGEVDDHLGAFEHEGITLRPVSLTQDDIDDFYEGFSNGTLWPLYHGGIQPANIHRHWWDAYRRVNERFAKAAIETVGPGGTVWVHDYHLQLVPALVREARPDVSIAFFLHTPFPPTELLLRLPWREELAKGLMGADIIGLQTKIDTRHVLALCRRVLGLPEVTLAESHVDVVWEGRAVRIGAYPIAIDTEQVQALAADTATQEAAVALRASLGNPRWVILGVDRLDYTKGIDARLRALAELLEEGRLHADDVALVQVATPSRKDVIGYSEMRVEVERLSGAINGDFASVGHPVVHYLHQSFSFEELMVMYLAADVMLVTPYRDGMNLVAKEYVAARLDGTGTILLSEFAGTAEEFVEALTCNPFDIDGMKNAIMHALGMPVAEQTNILNALQARLQASSVHDWARNFLGELD